MKKKNPTPLITVSELAAKANPRNPRSITPEKLATLKESMMLYGDLGGIVLNRRTNHLIGGHQRIKTFEGNKSKATVHLSHELEKPDRTGTLRYGYIEVDGVRYSYREVDWPAAKEKGAMLAANKFSGEFVWEEVSKLLHELEEENYDLSLTGFDAGELKNLLAAEWQPPGVEKMPGAENPVAPIHLTAEQRALFEQVCSKVSEVADTEGKVVELLCREFLK